MLLASLQGNLEKDNAVQRIILFFFAVLFSYTRHSRHTGALYISINLVKLHHPYTRDPVCGGQARLACLSNGVFKNVQLVEKVQNQRASTCFLQLISSDQLKELDNPLLSKYNFGATQRIQLIFIRNKEEQRKLLFFLSNLPFPCLNQDGRYVPPSHYYEPVYPLQRLLVSSFHDFA